MYCNLFDAHMHSHNSPDGSDSVMFMAQTAYDRGLSGIAITDHFEMDFYEEKSYGVRLAHSVEDTLEARVVFRGKLDIALGVEIAQLRGKWNETADTIAKYPFDIVLASVHRFNVTGDFYTVDYKTLSKKEIDNMMHDYFDQMIELLNWGNYDVLSHLNFPVRCAMKNSGVAIDLRRYQDRVDEALTILRDQGKGLEINTSGLRGPLAETMPPSWAIRRFWDMKGEIVTVGSDAHCRADTGEGIQIAMQLAQDAGFEYFAFYRERKPVMLRIV